MHSEQGAVHFEILSAINGRIRIQLEQPLENESAFRNLPGIRSLRYNPRIRTLLCEYDADAIREEALIVQLGAIYASQTKASLLHIKRSEEKDFSMAPSGYLALACIGLDGLSSLSASPFTAITHWVAAGSTLAAVVEHGYRELSLRGSFDPEVMSVVYLINSVGKPDAFRASLLAWIITFSRHLIPRSPREQQYLIRRSQGQLTLTPMQSGQSELTFAGNMFRRGVEMMAKKN